MILNFNLIVKTLALEQRRDPVTGKFARGERILVRRFSKQRSFADVIDLLLQGPCEVEFNRVYSKRKRESRGPRTMRCIKASRSPMNAFDPRFPLLIAVMELGTARYKSFYYGQLFSITRLVKSELNYAERDTVVDLRGEDYDYSFPGIEDRDIEGYELREQPEHQVQKKLRQDQRRVLHAHEDVTIVVPDNPYLRNS